MEKGAQARGDDIQSRKAITEAGGSRAQWCRGQALRKHRGSKTHMEWYLTSLVIKERHLSNWQKTLRSTVGDCKEKNKKGNPYTNERSVNWYGLSGVNPGTCTIFKMNMVCDPVIPLSRNLSQCAKRGIQKANDLYSRAIFNSETLNEPTGHWKRTDKWNYMEQDTVIWPSWKKLELCVLVWKDQPQHFGKKGAAYL